MPGGEAQSGAGPVGKSVCLEEAGSKGSGEERVPGGKACAWRRLVAQSEAPSRVMGLAQW